MVKIETEKTIVRNTEHYKILSIDMLKGSQLPKIYKEKENVFLAYDGRSITYSMGGGHYYVSWLTAGQEYTKSDLDIKLKIIKRCCDKLKSVRLNMNWRGNETFLF